MGAVEEHLGWPKTFGFHSGLPWHFGSTITFGDGGGIPRAYNVLDGVEIGSEIVRAAGDGTTDNSAVLQRIMNHISSLGGGIMWFPPATYMCRSSIWIRSNVTIDGVPGTSILTSDVDGLLGIFRSDQVNAVYDFTVRNVKFLGNVTEEPSIPQANRTRNPSPFHAIKINGSFAPNTTDDFGQPTSGPVIQNVTIDNITVQNMASLPVTIFGVTGRCVTRNSIFRNCKDAGWVFNEELVCVDNHSINSSDNGFSLSRGNRKVVCVGNTVENAALFGIWLSGYNSDIGPSDFTCTGNTIIGTGRSCINLDFGPSKGVISGNYMYQGYHRGPFDAVSDSGIDGITITGASGGIHADSLSISGNLIIAPARNGITVKECDNTKISGNTIINPGTQYKANGSTPINAGDLTSNHGICTITLNSYANVRIEDNYLIENRGTPYGNWPVYKVNTSGTKAYNNKHIGAWRNNVNELDIVDAAVSGSPIQFNINGGNGTDGGDVDVDAQMNLQGAGKLHIRNSDGSGLNVESTSTSSAAKSTVLLSAGGLTNYVGAVTAGRLDASSNSRFAVRLLSNGSLSGSDTTAPFYIEGSSSGAFIALNAGIKYKDSATKTTTATLTISERTVPCDATAGAFTVSLPAASTCAGLEYVVKKIDSSGNAITIDGSGSETIDGATTYSLASQYKYVIIHSNGTGWWVVGSN